jgi:predicted CXXCH cytochrome family protein
MMLYKLNYQNIPVCIFLYLTALLLSANCIFAQENDDCLMCHSDNTIVGKKDGKTFSVFVDSKKLASSVHSDVQCIDCHADLADSDFPHKTDVAPAQCIPCHEDEETLYTEGIHGKAKAKSDPLAPICQNCHGSHDIVPVKDIRSAVSPIKIPFVCGSCHKEGTKVQIQRHIPQDHILENYSESLHGVGLMQKGLSVAANCASCHSPHKILPPSDPQSTIARKNIANTCTQCHQEIEIVHRKIIEGKLWEQTPHVLPVCIDCHPPHKIKQVLYEESIANQDCLNCHGRTDLKSIDGRSMFVDVVQLESSVHTKISCSQCHNTVNPSLLRPCTGITAKIDCSICHAEIGDQYRTSIHGQLFAKQDKNAPTCEECHGSHGVLAKSNSSSPTFPTNIPTLCGKCHRTGEPAAVRYIGLEHDILTNYTESIHGKGLMKSGLTVTATCTDCHTSHEELPHDDPKSSINRINIVATCGRCHYGIEKQLENSVHSPSITKTNQKLPVCYDCHSAHKISRTDDAGFRLEIMNICGNCHKKYAETYFTTYHGQVSRLGYGKTAKCWDCHGAHDILPVENSTSHLSFQNRVQTCKKCHEGATRQFAGYFTHATHHEPGKYPFLFWTFWGMTGLLVFTFVIAGIHTILWLPRSLQWRRQLKKKKAVEKNNKSIEGNNVS